MTSNSTATDRTRTATDWQVDYDVDPIEIRDPVAEALGVLAPGDPFVISYTDAVKEAGHSCPTAAGAYRITQLGLDTLYSDSYPVRSEVEVQAPRSRKDATHGVMSRIISYVTGATEEDGFSGLAGGYGGRRDLLRFDAFNTDTAAPTFRFRRADTDETVQVIYHVSDVPAGAPAVENLQQILDGSASDQQRQAFGEAWHRRVQVVLSDDSLFTTEAV